MKLQPGRADAFLRDPGPARVVLLHGDDEGLVRQRANALTLAVAGAADDPFRVAWLDPESHNRLEEEASAIAMLGGRRVVRVRGGGDRLLPELQAVLASRGDGLVVLESPALNKRSRLLVALEAAPNAAVLRCDPAEGAGLRAAVTGGLEAEGVRADRDALDWLCEHLGGDHLSTRGEIAKLALYAGRGGHLDLDAARVCVGDQAATSMDDAAFAASGGDVPGADLAVERALAEGVNPVAQIRVLLGHMARLQQLRARVDAGTPADAAVKALRPPVFWKKADEMVRALSRWTAPRLAAAVGEIRRTELACKQTGAPAELIVRRLVLTLARQAAAARR